MDQMDRVLYDLKNNPFSRRIITNTYVHEDLSEMHLYPCAYSTTWNVTEEKGSDKLVLNMVLNQRSQDVLAANNWNVCQYAILLMMVAQVCDMVPGELLHVIADAHIYDRHVDGNQRTDWQRRISGSEGTFKSGGKGFLPVHNRGPSGGGLSGRTAD